MKDNYTEAAQALSYVNPNCPRDDWWPILAGLKSEFGDNAYGLARDWSQRGDTFNEQDFDSHWRSLTDRGITIKTVYKQAIDAGWKSDGSGKPIRIPPRPKLPPPQSKTKPYAVKLYASMCRSDHVVAAHPYAIAKGIDWACGAGVGKASGSVIGQDAECIIVPMRALEGIFSGVECINAEGAKQTFGHKGVLKLGNTLDKSLPVHIAEGWASTVSMWRIAANCLAIVVFGNKNLDRVADQMPERECHIWRDAP